MSPETFDIAAWLQQLRQRDIQLELEGDALKVRGRRDALTPETRALLAQHRDRLLAHLRAAGAVPAVEADEFPLTDVQQAYWIGRGGLDLGGIGCHAYREFEAPPSLDVAALQRAWRAVVARHEMLRAVVTPEGRNRVLAEVPAYAITELDWRGDPQAGARLAQLREAMSHQVFDPARWPLFDIRVTRLDDALHVHVGMDLLIADAASMLQLYREWAAFYVDSAAALPPPPRRFAEFVRAQAADERAQARAAAYWMPRLPDLPGPPELPSLAPGSGPVATAGPVRFERHSRTLPAAQWQQLKALAREEGLTPSNLLLAAYADVLAAYSRRQHFLLTLTTFRVPPGFQGVVGDFTSTLLLEVDARAERFVDRARALQQRLAQDLDVEGWSGVRVARERARLAGDAAQPVPVVFTSALGHRAAGETALPLAWLGRTVHAITQTPQVWIDHHVIEDGDQLLCSWDVLAGVLPPALVAAMFEAHGRLLDALTDAQHSPQAWQAPLGWHVAPADAERRARANATAAPMPTGLLHSAFFDQAQRAPERLAVLTPTASLRFGELADWARAVQAEVRAHGVAAGELVAVDLPKGWQQVAAVLGIVAAGAAYLPLDHRWPAARRAQLMARGRVRLVVGDEAPAGLQRIDLATLQPRRAPVPGPVPAPQDLAYVIFTSGSTGEPKGVMIEHQAALNTLAHLQQRLALGPGDAVLGLSSLAFDLSVFDIFGVLGAGGQLVLPAPGRERDPGHWSGLMAAHQVSLWNSVPALLEMLLAHGADFGGHLRLALLSGDWIALNLAERLRSRVPAVRVLGLGGATEASIWSNWFEIGAIDPAWRSIPYGWPLANQRFHVLNTVLEPAPAGVTGALYIAGAGLARGYWDDPALTEHRFVCHPRSGERLYATGDLGRYLPDGAIEFLGREDQQVKLGGQRVELGEIEACLAHHPQVAQAVAYVEGEALRGRRLGVAVVARPSAALPRAETPADEAALLERARPPSRREGDASTAWITLGEAPAERSAWRQRRSVRAFDAQPVPLQALADWLGASRGLQGAGEEGLAPKFRYPSAGSLYALQTWLLVQPGRVAGLDAGLYHHHPIRHALEPVAAEAHIPLQAHADVNRALAEGAAFSLLLVAPLEDIAARYGAAARDFALLEAGYLGQLLMEEAALRGLGLCPIGGLDASLLPPVLELGPQRQLVHSFIGGLPADEAGLAETLRRWLAAQLPAAMVPARIALLPQLPLGPNGKVDRARVAALVAADAQQRAPAVATVPPDRPSAGATAAPSAPRSDTARALEPQLQALFAEVLDLPAVPLDVGLFALGGTSLHVVRLHRRLEQSLGRPLDIVALFRHSSVAALAAWLSQ